MPAFFSGYSTNKSDHQYITEILLKVALNNITPYLNAVCDVCVFAMWYEFKGRAILFQIFPLFCLSGYSHMGVVMHIDKIRSHVMYLGSMKYRISKDGTYINSWWICRRANVCDKSYLMLLYHSILAFDYHNIYSHAPSIVTGVLDLLFINVFFSY